MMLYRKPALLAAAALLLCALAALGFQAARQRAAAALAPPASMAALLPQGALLTIESPDFAALLRQWNASPEQKSWLASDNYAVFSNSRLFSRLDDARAEFEAAAGANPRAGTRANSRPNSRAAVDSSFLKQIAGRESIFAWYDVGNLEFLYVTRMPAAQASSIALLQARGSWTRREAAGIPFFVRESSASAAANPDSGEADEPAAAPGKARTVAFAEIPDPANPGGPRLLVLATREDLIAGALENIQASRKADAAHPPNLPAETWYSEASAALAPSGPAGARPALHMVLNLARLVPQPYFRSYWVQRNVTAMMQYRAAAADLYLDKNQFREERALLPSETLPDPQPDPAASPDLAALAALLPESSGQVAGQASGVFRATAFPAPETAVAALDEKILGHPAPDALPATAAPDPSLDAPLDAPQSGSVTDLETRIDTPAAVTAAASSAALTEALRSSGLHAMLTYSTALPPSSPTGLWVPIHSAVILEASGTWNPDAIQSGLQRSLRGSLTTATLGIDFRAEQAGNLTIHALTGPRPLFFAVASTRCIVSDNRALLESILREIAAPRASNRIAGATVIAAFDHTAQRAPFARLTSLIDGTNQPPRGAPSAQNSPAVAATVPATPTFFSNNIRSLSDSFAPLAAEHFTERRDGPNLRQTVTYQWH